MEYQQIGHCEKKTHTLHAITSKSHDMSLHLCHKLIDAQVKQHKTNEGV